MKPGPIGPDNMPRMRLAQLRNGISHNTHMNIRLGPKAPTHIFTMGSNETIYYRNVSVKMPECQTDTLPFSIILNDRNNFKRLASVLSDIPLAYVYDPHGNFFAFSPWDFDMSHEDLSRSLLVNALSPRTGNINSAFRGIIQQAMLLKGAFVFDENGYACRFSTIIMTSKEEKNPVLELMMAMQTYLKLALLLRSFGCPLGMTIEDYVPREGMNRFHGFLKNKCIFTLGEILNKFEGMV
jgi:hypothetical protein